MINSSYWTSVKLGVSNFSLTFVRYIEKKAKFYPMYRNIGRVKPLVRGFSTTTVVVNNQTYNLPRPGKPVVGICLDGTSQVSAHASLSYSRFISTSLSLRLTYMCLPSPGLHRCCSSRRKDANMEEVTQYTRVRWCARNVFLSEQLF